MIDTSMWKEFKLSDIGFKNFHGIRQKQSDRVDGNIPLLTAGKENQGVASYIGNPESTYVDSISVDMFGNSFFHKGEYAGDDNIYFFVNDDVSDEAKIFIAAVINKDNTRKYVFKDQFRQSQADALSVYLPTTSDNQPDWTYMESYMKQIIDESGKSLENLKKADGTKHLVDVREWKDVQITDLFELSLPKGDLQVKRVSDGNIPLITPSNYNNGLLLKIAEDSPSTLYKKGSLTVDMFGNAYYQNEDFFVTAHGHINVLLPKMNLNLYTGMFLASTIRARFFDKYGFNEMCTLKVLKSEYIKLPIISTGEPDWQYMENYMKTITEKSVKTVDSFNSVLK
ncbi:MAG: restriction endonuclease subunit S [Eubacterium sp.]|nr:restriction endonuclease subunit S [Eubacterium sp.]